MPGTVRSLLILRTALTGAMTDEAAEAKRGLVAQPSWDPTQLGSGKDKIQIRSKVLRVAKPG